ncbi:MAG: MFS transporter [Myxococcales bacterium]|jgi:MFS family permease
MSRRVERSVRPLLPDGASMADAPGSMADARHPTLQVLALRPVRLFSVGQFLSTLGFSLLRATVAWHIWKVTGSYALLGTLGLVEFLPVVPLSLVGGAVADSRDRRRIVVTTLSTSAVLATILIAAASTGQHELPAILVTAFLLAVSNAFQRPAYSALLPTLVPTDLFPSATVVNANVRNAALVSGPVLMGFITRGSGIAAAYTTTAVLFGCAAAFLFRLPRVRRQGPARAVSWQSVREGLSFVRSRPAILSSMALDMLAVVFAGANALLPVFADEILGVGELGYGLLSASMQIGTLLMAAILLVLPPLQQPGRWLLWSVVFFGLSTVVFGLSRSFPLSVAAFVIAGMADQVSMTARSIILQLSTPDELRGRVSSVGMIFIGASNELGAAESGYLAALTGATFSVVFGGFACLAIVGATALRVPALRNYRVGAPRQTPPKGQPRSSA